jgi:predicted nucleic acid-binding protein
VSYVLDTTVIVDYVNGREPAPALVHELFETGETLYTCDVVTCEALSAGSDEERRLIRSLLDALEYVAVDPEAARWAAESRRRPDAGGRVRNLGDALIAAVAWRNEAAVVTRNPDDFIRQGVRVRAY